MNQSNIHYRYWIGILIALLVFLFTYKFTQNKHLVDYVSFAATLASLVLAILAIFIPIFSNNSLEKNIEKISDKINELSKESNQITGQSKSIREMIRQLKDVSKRVRENSKVIKAFEEGQNSPSIVTADIEKTSSETIVDNFLAKSSLSGLYVLYAIYVATERQVKYFKNDFIENLVGFTTYQYIYGFLVAASASDFVGIDIDSEGFTITSIHSELSKSKIEGSAQPLIDRFLESYPENKTISMSNFKEIEEAVERLKS